MVTDEMLKRAIEAYAKETGAEDWQLDGWINSAIRAALEAALSAQVQDVAGWQPIETAPKDGSTFIALASKGLLTHWMPLPAAPAKQEASHVTSK
ncbi:hypothetical protein O9X81_00020 [Agrobacterium salinitolerans]|uniref:hypothetical protein n=1 Tax=Agrobacterium salinitolerans TaxID=1183413 RepID=UPI0022B85027|nr:hypothetical protein [Agrobacterium salinitolerans]MCZ7854993.1 hypothetical protein [Agrobacterium salinitolerans]